MAALRDYATLGGMPEIVKNHVDGNGILSSIKLQKALLDTYYDDLPKYALRSKEYQNVAEIFRKSPYVACKNFKLVEISRDIAASHIRHSLSLLEKAQILSFITSTAAIDYLLQTNSITLPIEVKSMAAGRLNSLKLFMENYKEVPFGIRLCGLNSEIKSKFLSLPHYALPELYSQLSNMGVRDFIKKYGLE